MFKLDVARIHTCRHDWEPLRALIAVRMDSVLDTYNKSRLAVDVGPPRPLLGGESFEGLQSRLHGRKLSLKRNPE